MYRTPRKEELYIGMSVEFREHGEFDMDVCTSSPEAYEQYLFNDEYTGWKWEERILDEQWYCCFKEFSEDAPWGEWKGLPTRGFIRVKI
jgi:hypothetical protein